MKIIKDFWNNKVVKNISGILFIGIALFGLYFYIDFRVENLFDFFQTNNSKLVSENNFLKKRIDSLEENLNQIEVNLGDVVNTQIQKNDTLTDQFSKINEEVSSLTKLAGLDSELLKKYSKVYFLNEYYVPTSLAKIPDEYISTTIVNDQILTEVLPFLEGMVIAGEEAGVNIQVRSAYRSFDTQAKIKEYFKVLYGSGANRFSADQGYSEHQLGATVDLTTLDTSPSLEGFEDTDEYKWMLENAYKYGFILSYPEGNDHYKYEPWHWRFVGKKLATYLYENELNFYDMEERKILKYLINIFDQ